MGETARNRARRRDTFMIAVYAERRSREEEWKRRERRRTTSVSARRSFEGEPAVWDAVGGGKWEWEYFLCCAGMEEPVGLQTLPLHVHLRVHAAASGAAIVVPLCGW